MRKLRLREFKLKKHTAKIWSVKGFSETKAHPHICCKTLVATQTAGYWGF